MADEGVAPAHMPQPEVVVSHGTRPGTDANVVVQILVGIAGAFVVSLVTGLLKGGRLNYLWALVNDRGPIQYIELFMFFMVAAQVFLKIRILRTQLRVIAEAPVDPSIDLNDDIQVQDLRKSLVDHPSFSESIVLSRLDRILAMWLATKDVARLSGWTGSESDRDVSSSDSSYALARVLIWAIPILGFIGTVQGLGSAVSGFADFLSGAAELAQIKQAIANVTIGLSIAFDTTFLALILTTIVMFPLSSLQRREENLFVEIDNYLDDALISRLPSPESKPIVIENLEDSIEAAFRRYIPDPDRYDEVFTRSIEKAASAVEDKFAHLVKNYESALRDLSTRLSEGLVAVGDTLEQSMRNVVVDMGTQEEVLMAKRREITAEESDHFKSLLAEVNEQAAGVADRYRESIDNLQATTRESAEQSLGAARELAGRMEEVVRMAAGIEELLKIEQSVERGLEGIAASAEFRTTLEELRKHLATTDAFCSRLSRPRIITFREEREGTG